MQYTKVSATAFDELQLNAGIVVDGFDPATGEAGNIIGVTSGGVAFAANPAYSDFGDGLDNVPGNTLQLKRVTHYDPVLSGTLMSITDDLAKQLSGAGAVSSNKITPSASLAAGDFDDIWLVGDYSAVNKTSQSAGATAGYCAIHLMSALNTTGFNWKSNDDNKAEFAFEFHGHYNMTAISTVPYEIYVKAGYTPPLLLTLEIGGFPFEFDPDEGTYMVEPEEWPEASVIRYSVSAGATCVCTVHDMTAGGLVPTRHENVRSGAVITWDEQPEPGSYVSETASVTFAVTCGATTNNYTIDLWPTSV